MNVNQATDAMFALLKAAWDAHADTTAVPLGYENVRMDTPGSDANGNPGPYARAWIFHESGGQETIGGTGIGKCMHVGHLVVQIFTAAGLGSVRANQIAQVAKRAVQGLSFGTNGWFSDTAVVELGTDRDRPAYRHTQLKSRFQYEENLGE